jgi:predicted polyphosphate/ATP-dependent NAD kinase
VTIGVVANPASGRDIRRLVAKASVFPTAEKANMVQRMLTAFSAVGVARAMLSTDLGGISSAVLRAERARRPGKDPAWPALDFCDEDPLTGGAQDTTNAVRRMVEEGAKVIVCLGGDGTARAAASACGEVPLLALSTGTNNAFPVMREATVAGLAAGLVAMDAIDPATSVKRVGALEVTSASRRELALVDVCVSSSRHIGSKALWNADGLDMLFCTFAEVDGIGLSSVAGLLCPSSRDSANGVALKLGPSATAPCVVHAPIAPGLVVPVGVEDFWPIRPGESTTLLPSTGVIAIDGEREIEPAASDVTRVTLLRQGPRCVDVHAVMTEAAQRGLLRSSWPFVSCTPREVTAAALSPTP